MDIGTDIPAFYEDFGTTARINNVDETGLFSEEELELGEYLGVLPTFRCRSRYAESSPVLIDGESYTIKAVKPLEFGEFMHFLELEVDS